MKIRIISYILRKYSYRFKSFYSYFSQYITISKDHLVVPTLFEFHDACFREKKAPCWFFFQGNSGSGRGSRGILRLWCWLAEVPLVRITALPFVTARYRRGGGGLARQEMKGADGRRGDRKIWWRVAAWVGGNVVSSETDVEMEWDRRFEGK